MKNIDMNIVFLFSTVFISIFNIKVALIFYRWSKAPSKAA